MNRTEYAADRIAQMARDNPPPSRLGTKEELRALCLVSVGTFNEAIKLAQARGFVTLRSGPGGGIFVAEQSIMVRLGNSILALDGDRTSVADAIRMRNALDPLLIEDALWNASPSDLQGMRDELARMTQAVDMKDATAFVRANWALHRAIAEVSPSTILRSVSTGLLELIESHTLDVRPGEEGSLPDDIADRLDLHARIIDAIEARDRDSAHALIARHNTSAVAPLRTHDAIT